MISMLNCIRHICKYQHRPSISKLDGLVWSKKSQEHFAHRLSVWTSIDVGCHMFDCTFFEALGGQTLPTTFFQGPCQASIGLQWNHKKERQRWQVCCVCIPAISLYIYIILIFDFMDIHIYMKNYLIAKLIWGQEDHGWKKHRCIR